MAKSDQRFLQLHIVHMTFLSFPNLRIPLRPLEEDRTKPPFVFFRQIPFRENRSDRLLVLDIGYGFQADEVRRRTPDYAVPARNALCGKAGRRVEAERTRAVIDEVADRRKEFRPPFRRDLKPCLVILPCGTMVTLLAGGERRPANAADDLAVVDTGDSQTADAPRGETGSRNDGGCRRRAVRM